MGRTSTAHLIIKVNFLYILQAVVSKCEIVIMVMVSTVYGTMKKMKQKQKREKLYSPKVRKVL
jgi:hypothetical protein